MMERDPRGILLVDLDGTLTDPADGIVGCFRSALLALGVNPPPHEELLWIIGPSLRRSFAETLDGKADPEEGLEAYRACYSTAGLFRAHVYDGVTDALTRLRAADVRLLLCTAKPAVYAERILRHFDLRTFFDAVYGSELDGRFDDKGDLIAHILENERLDAGDCCMWGDRAHDVVAAARHGIPTIGALWGFGGSDELTKAGAAVLCAAPSDVPAAFAALRRSPPALSEAAS
jgi:phosphoglycolate phosphatase